MTGDDPWLVARSRSATLPGELTERQVRILRLMRGSLTFSEIATELSLSPNTIKTHTQAIYRKLGVRTREDAVIRGLDRGILSRPIRNGRGIGQAAIRPAQSPEAAYQPRLG